MATIYRCGEEERRNQVRGTDLNAIDFLEVIDQQAIELGAPEELRQKLLAVRCFREVPSDLTALNVKIDGGVRITPVRALWALPQSQVAGAPATQVSSAEKDLIAAYLQGLPNPQRYLFVRTDSSGDFSTYVLRLIELQPSHNFDRRLSEVEFSFKVECPSDFDCSDEPECPSPAYDEPEIDYLAKDYGSFRTLMLDRLSTVAPDWRERSPADLGVALVELLAYVGDQLSYYQDAVATEAYLGTARKRVSVRRHARLVDYHMHEGVNARTWVHFTASAGGDGVLVPGADRRGGRPGTLLLTRTDLEQTLLPLDELTGALNSGAFAFETLHDLTLRRAHNEISFYTWGDERCCLPAGATEATLVGPLPELAVGDLLLFEEVLGPNTGNPADADPAHRHVVRLTEVRPLEDLLADELSEEERAEKGIEKDVVQIAWSPIDAPPFPICISAVTEDRRALRDVSVARGNLVLADHGLTLDAETLSETVPLDRPYEPALERGPLTWAVPLPEDFRKRPAAEGLPQAPREATPAVWLEVKERIPSEVWRPVRDLLASDRFALEFVVEMREDGIARLRFGDNTDGRAPVAGTEFSAHYRVGNGPAGNLGAGGLFHLVIDPERMPGEDEDAQAAAAAALSGAVEALTNPLAAQGGRAPESMEEVRRFAPQAFRVQERAVTEADYAAMAALHPEVQRATATFRWTGSWYTVFLTADRVGGRKVDDEFREELRRHMNLFRMAGYDLEVDDPEMISLYLEMRICVLADYFRSEVKAALLERFSNRLLDDGSLGFFHPDNWTFNQPVYLSRIYAAASGVEGVESVEVLRFERWARAAEDEIDNGVLPIGRLEIARLDNDPNFPENGQLKLLMAGGK